MVTLTTSFTPKLNSPDWRSIPNIAKIQLLLSKTSLAQEKQPETPTLRTHLPNH